MRSSPRPARKLADGSRAGRHLPAVVTAVMVLVASLWVGTAPAATASPIAVEAMAPTRWTSVSGGEEHTCGLLDDGTARCWGDDRFDRTTPLPGEFTQISVAAYHACGLRPAGDVACWGYNDDGRGNPPAGNFTQLSVGRVHLCVLAASGTVVCTGANNYGQSAVPAGTYSQVSAYDDHTCAVRTDATLACWGQNWWGQSTPPGGTFSKVEAGLSHTCAIQTDGAVACWGRDNTGQASPPSGTFTQLTAGPFHTCGLRTDGAVACWGANWAGQATPPAGTFTQISTGAEHTCGVETTGTLACWGSDGVGQSTPPAIPQTIEFTSLPPAAVVGGPGYTVSATSTSGLPVGFSVDGPTAGTCTVSGDVVAFIGAGTCSILADQAGDADHLPATQVLQSLAVAKVPQTIAFTSSAPAAPALADEYTATATGGGSGNPVVFSAATPSTDGACTVSPAGLVRFTAVGSCVIGADQAGDAAHLDATPAQQTVTVVATPALSGFTSLPPARVWDSRVGPGPIGRLAVGQVGEITVTGMGGVPATGVTAVVLNVTAVESPPDTFVTVWPSGSPRPSTSNLNVPIGDTRPNLVVVAVGANGKVSFSTDTGSVDLVADVAGYHGAGGATYTSLPAARLWDSRVGPGPIGRLGVGQVGDITVTGMGGVPATGVTAVVLNVTAVDPSRDTFVTVWPSGSPRPSTSNLNVPIGDTRPNLVVVAVGANGKVSFSTDTGSVDLVADVAGYHGAGGATYTSLPAARLWDSRVGPGPIGRLGVGQVGDITVTGTGGAPTTGITAVVLNVTAVGATAQTFITAWPTGGAQPPTSNLNVPIGDTRSNLVVVPVGADGRVSFRTDTGSVDLVVDIAGYYGTEPT